MSSMPRIKYTPVGKDSSPDKDDRYQFNATTNRVTLVNEYIGALHYSAKYYDTGSKMMYFSLNGRSATKLDTIYNETHEYIVCYTNNYEKLQALLGSDLCVMLRRHISTRYTKSLNSDNCKYSSDSINSDESINLNTSNNKKFIDKWIKGFTNGNIKYRGSYVWQGKTQSLIRTIYTVKSNDKIEVKTVNSRLNNNPRYLGCMLTQMKNNMKDLTCNVANIDLSEPTDISV